MKPTYFRTPSAFRTWLKKHHTSGGELLVGFYKRDSGKPSLTWPESVDEALCFGWIDGIRRRVDEVSYTIRFTPRKRGSTWSAINIRRANALIADGLMQPAGLNAFQARTENRSGIYAYEQRSVELVAPYDRLLKQSSRAAWDFFQSQPPSYRKVASWWIVSAKKEETRRKRLKLLALHSARRERLPQYRP